MVKTLFFAGNFKGSTSDVRIVITKIKKHYIGH